MKSYQTLLAIENNRNQKGNRTGLGYYTDSLPENRLKKTQFKVSENEIRKFLLLYKGISPYNESDTWMKKMLNWDLITHEKHDEYFDEVHIQENPTEFKKMHKDAWVKWMKTMNCWISFYEWYYSGSSLTASTPIPFEGKIVKMLQK